jgi:hypothetical protein
MDHLLDLSLIAIHLLSAAAWFGSLVYRVLIVDPKALKLLGDGVGFERYSLHLAHGMRYVVLAALVTCGLSGFVLVGLRWSESGGWQSLMGVKAGLWLLASALFGYISWVYWPRRVFADATEWKTIRRRGLLLSLVMIGIAVLGMLLGQIGQTIRTAPAEGVSQLNR